MRLAQLAVAATVLLPIVSSLAQSTPATMNKAVRAQLVQEKTGYTSPNANDRNGHQ
jgi:hypothetical protein